MGSAALPSARIQIRGLGSQVQLIEPGGQGGPWRSRGSRRSVEVGQQSGVGGQGSGSGLRVL